MSEQLKESKTETASPVDAPCYVAEQREKLFGYLKTMEDDELRAVVAIVAELESARDKHPKYPNDVIHQAAIVGEEAGELTRAALQSVYENGSRSECRSEAVQVGAMALRFLLQR